MPKPPLTEEEQKLQNDLIAAFMKGHERHRPDLSYPQSQSDMEAGIREVMKQFRIYPALKEPPAPAEFKSGAESVRDSLATALKLLKGYSSTIPVESLMYQEYAEAVRGVEAAKGLFEYMQKLADEKTGRCATVSVLGPEDCGGKAKR